MNIAITFSLMQVSGLQAELNAYNGAQPEGSKPLSLDAFASLILTARADAAVRAYGAIPVFDFVQRFTTTEYDDVKTRAKTDPNCAALLVQLSLAEDGKVHLWKNSVVQGLAYLVSLTILTPDRAAVIGAIS